MSDFIKTEIPGVIVIEPRVFRDERGFFLESYQEAKYRDAGITETFVQDNHSKSTKGILRGLHAQNPHPQGKLVRVTTGEVYDVVVDARKGSPSYGKHFATHLSADNFRQLYVPPGLLHGFLVTQRRLYRRIAQETLDYVLREMTDPLGRNGPWTW